MLSLHEDQLDSAHEEVFGYKPSRYDPRPPSSSPGATPSRPQPRPPSAPTARPPSSRRPPRQPVRAALGVYRTAQRPRAQTALAPQRQTSRKRVVFSDNRTSPAPAAPELARRPSGDGVHVRRQYYASAAEEQAQQDKGVSYGEYSSAIVRGSGAAPEFLSGMHTSQDTVSPAREAHGTPTLHAQPPTNPYYLRHPMTTAVAHPGLHNAAALSGASAGHPPLHHSASPHHRPSSAPSATVNVIAVRGDDGRTTPASARPMTADSHTAEEDETLPPRPASCIYMDRSTTASNVFERLAGETAIGTSTLGKRVLQWARGAQLSLRPSKTAWNALHLYSANPLQYERVWRRTCAKGRYRVTQLARGKLRIAGGDGAGSSAGGSHEHSLSHHPVHGDPHRSQSNPTGKSASGGGGHKGRGSNPGSTVGGLCVFRCREEYKRWCYWQLCHFFEQGSKYLTSVWRVQPTLGPHRHQQPASTVGGVSATALLPSLFAGRYIVPCVRSIDESRKAYKEQVRHARAIVRLLMEERPPAPSADAARADGHAADEADKSFLSDTRAPGASDEEDDGEDAADVFHAVNESRRSSEAVAATEPFLEVRVDEATGRMHLSLYANGDEGGNGADFVGSSVAACIDNHRWVIIKGLWLREVLVFHFHRPTGERLDGAEGQPQQRHGGTGRHVDSEAAACGYAYSEQEEQMVVRSSHCVDGLVVKGVAFTKVPAEGASAGAQDTFLCSRCGHTRKGHNGAYISKRTGRLVRGVYYCSICQRRTHHVRLPPMEALSSHMLAELKAAAAGTYDSQAPSYDMTPMTAAGSLYSPTPSAPTPHLRTSGSLPSATVSALSRGGRGVSDVALATKALQEWTRVSAVSPRPAWYSRTQVNEDEVFGRTRGLDCPPARPSM